MSGRLAKLRTMRPGEIGTRIAGRAYAVWERRRVARPAPPPDERVRRALRRDLASGSAWRDDVLARRLARQPRMLPSLDRPALTVAALREHFSREVAETLSHADAARRNAFHFFGRTWEYGDRIDWHRDPLSGQHWPLVYHEDVPIAGGPGDAKDVWEINRHQFLLDLGKARWLTGDAAWSRAATGVVRDWIAANPYGLGVNWASALEVGYRALSWLWTYELVADDLAVTPDVHLEWLASLVEHGRFLNRHLELYASPYNHLVGEASCLYLLGVLLPEFAEAPRWRARGRRILESRLGEQFHDDGGSVEQATVYHHATLGFYLLAALVGRAHGEVFASEVWQAIERGIDFGAALQQPDGRLPAIGDNDDARPIRMERRDLWDFRHFQSVGAMLFDRADFAWSAGRLHEDALWLLGPDAVDRFARLAKAAPALPSRVLPSSGYVALRTAWGPGGDYACFDCGEQAGGLRPDDVPSAAHGHADCLSVVACLRGSPVLVDAGFYTYARDEAWERHFRETAAHNTVRIDGRDQARHLAQMAWTRAPRVRLEAWHLGETGGGWAVASHDGYARGGWPVTHRRTVWLHEGLLIVLDELTGAGEHAAEVIYQFAPGLEVTHASSSVRVGAESMLAWAGTFPLQARVQIGEPGPDGGWVAPGLGICEPAARLVVSGAFDARDARVLTVLGHGHVACASRRPDGEEGAPALVAHIETDGTSIVILAPPPGGADWGTDAKLVAWRLRGAEVESVARVGGSRVDCLWPAATSPEPQARGPAASQPE